MPTRKPNEKQQILDAIQKLDDKINLVLYGDAGNNTPGLMERVRKLEEWANSEKRLVYLIVGIIIADVVSRLWALIAK